MLGRDHSGDTAYEDCLEWARVQMPPSTLFWMFATSELFLESRIAKLGMNGFLEPHLDLFGWNI
jgi:hypothetical protein